MENSALAGRVFVLDPDLSKVLDPDLPKVLEPDLAVGKVLLEVPCLRASKSASSGSWLMTLQCVGPLYCSGVSMESSSTEMMESADGGWDWPELPGSGGGLVLAPWPLSLVLHLNKVRVGEFKTLIIVLKVGL